MCTCDGISAISDGSLSAETTSDSNSAIKSVKITALSSVCKYIGRTKSNILQCLKSWSQGKDKLTQFISSVGSQNHSFKY